MYIYFAINCPMGGEGRCVYVAVSTSCRINEFKKKLSCVMKQRNVFNSDDIMLRNKETTRTF